LKAGEQRRFATRKPVPLRRDYDAALLRRLARESEDADQVRRLLALALIYDGGSRTQAAAVGGVTLQVVRDWVLRFNAHGPEGLIDRKAPGQPSRLQGEHRAALVAMVETGPIAAVHGVVRWRIIDLCQWVWDEFEIIVSQQTLSRELRAMGFRKLSARPHHHSQAPDAVAAFKKKFPAKLAGIARKQGVGSGRRPCPPWGRWRRRCRWKRFAGPRVPKDGCRAWPSAG
jgi:transposase